MKIGIITQPLHTNYGGLLQNYALQKVLSAFGHEVKNDGSFDNSGTINEYTQKDRNKEQRCWYNTICCR